MTQETKPELRSAKEDDDEFLFAVYASSRRNEVGGFGWDEPRQEAFLRMQFNSRRGAYLLQFPNAEQFVILTDGTAVGSVIIDRRQDSISLTDIAVLPEFRGRRIATNVIRSLQQEARMSRIPLLLSVDKTNVSAQKFYERLGFCIAGESQINYSMKWAEND